MAKRYEKPSLSPLSMAQTESILEGSDTNKPMKVQNVTVEDYHDGFETQGGFQEITFD